MAHPKMFSDDDPLLARVRQIALALPDAAEKVSHGRPAFYTTKVFAYYGASVKVDRRVGAARPSATRAAGRRRARRAGQRAALLRPGLLGPYGWLGLDLDEDTDWTEVAELVEMSYRQTAGPRRIAALDAS